MGNPFWKPGTSRTAGATRLKSYGRGSIAQIISDTKFASKTLPLGVAAASTDFFTTAPSADQTLDYYDGANQLVTSQKAFTIQAIAVNVTGAATAAGLADVDNIIQKGVIVLTSQNKEIGRFRLRHLCAAGGTFVAGAQVAAASNVGVVNGNPLSDPWRIADLRIETNQTFKATLFMPTTTPVTLSAAAVVEIDLIGYEERPAA